MLCVLAVATGVVVGTASADGLPVPHVGATGVAAPATGDRYVTAAVGRDTIVARIERKGAHVVSSRVVRGPLTIPAVAFRPRSGHGRPECPLYRPTVAQGSQDLGSMRLSLSADGNRMSVGTRAATVAVVDTRTFTAAPVRTTRR